MCGQDEHHNEASASQSPPSNDEHFPWHIGVFDVHNHVAERLRTLEQLPSMKARSVTVMATRSQDQQLVADMICSHGLKSEAQLAGGPTTVVGGFGWHPWFSHELYDDSVADPSFVACEDVEASKKKHYQQVLTPKPEEETFWRDLPVPKPLSSFIGETRSRLLADPLAMVGEIGLDKAFRLPMPWQEEARAVRDPARTPGGRERRPLSRHNIDMAHQKAVLLAQLRLAGEVGRPVSVHGVQVHGVLFDCLTSCWKGHELRGKRSRQKQARQTTASQSSHSDPSNKEEYKAEEDQDGGKPYPPRICLHSFSGRGDAVKQYLRPSIPALIFFSLSWRNNFGTPAAAEKAEDALRLVPDDRILVESDLHEAGPTMDAHLEATCRRICAVKGWTLEEGVARMAANYRLFVFGL